MQKCSSFLALLACLVTLTACGDSTDGEKDGYYFTENLEATQTVFDSLVSKDAEGIKELLCERLKNEPDVDAQLQHLLDSIDGHILPMDMEGVRSVNSAGYTKQDGVYTEMYSFGRVKNPTTDTGKTYQQLLVFYCFVDKLNPDMEGVYAITLVESDTVSYEVFIPERAAEPEEDYGTVYTPDGPRPATKEEQEAMLGEGATE